MFSLSLSHNESHQVPSDVSASYEWSLDLENWFGDGADNGSGLTVNFSEDSRIADSAGGKDVLGVSVSASGNPPSLFVRLRIDLAVP